MKKFSRMTHLFSHCTVVSLLLLVSLTTLAVAQTISSDRELFTFPETVDLYFAYHSTSTQAILLVPANGVSVILFAATPFEQVNASLIDPSGWKSVDFIEMAFGDTVALRRSTGEMYKLTYTFVPTSEIPQLKVTYAPVSGSSSSPMQPSVTTLSFYQGFDLDTGDIIVDATVASVIFCDLEVPVEPTPTQNPSVIPEPGSGLLLLLGLFGLFGARLFVRRRGKHVKRIWGLLGMFSVVSLMFFGSLDVIVAQQGCLLTVEKSGNGTGRVVGRGIDCGNVCSVSSGHGEVLNLKAIPDEGSTFVGWLVDGNPYQGITRMSHATTLTAVFEPHSPTITPTPTATPTVMPDSCVVTTEADSGVGSLRQILAKSPCCTTITFTSAVNTITLGGTELIVPGTCTNLTIDGSGSGNVTISGDNRSRVMAVNSGANVTLDALTITKGKAANYGGGIDNGGTLTIDNTTLINGNTAAIQGGGIYNSGTLTISGTVSENTASGTTWGGGGIYNESGSVTVTVSGMVSGNTTTGNGGGIRNYSGTVTVSGVVSGNTGMNGGGISSEGHRSTLTVSGTVSGNTATGDGGGIAGGYGVTISGTISGNTAMRGGGMVTGNMTFRGTISGNRAQFGGGVWNEGRFNIDPAGRIINNSATTLGGGIYNYHNSVGGIAIVGGARATTVNGNTAPTCDNFIDDNDGDSGLSQRILRCLDPLPQ